MYQEEAYREHLLGLIGEIANESGESSGNLCLVNKNMSWAALSWLQKSIRRGNKAGATMAASVLWNSDMRDLLWRRLCVIGIEDCGFPALRTTNMAMLMDTKGGHLQLPDEAGFKVAARIISDLCGLFKDRSVAEAYLIPRYGHPHYKRSFDALPSDNKSRIPIMMDSNIPLVDRLAAATALTRSAKGREMLLSEVEVSHDARFASEVYGRLNHDNMWRNLLFLDTIIDTGTAGYEEDLHNADFTYSVGGVPEYTWDRYVSRGKQFLARLRKVHSTLWRFTEGLTYDEAIDRLGWGLFIVEGGRMDTVINYPDRLQLAKLTLEGAAYSRNMSLPDARDMCLEMLRTWSEIRDIRVSVVKGTTVYTEM